MFVIVFLYIVFTLIAGFTTAVMAWVEYGIIDDNLLRVALKSLRGFVWPVWVVINLRRYMRERFAADWQELFPRPETHVEKPRIDSTQQREDYQAGQWKV